MQEFNNTINENKMQVHSCKIPNSSQENRSLCPIEHKNSIFDAAKLILSIFSLTGNVSRFVFHLQSLSDSHYLETC